MEIVGVVLGGLSIWAIIAVVVNLVHDGYRPVPVDPSLQAFLRD